MSDYFTHLAARSLNQDRSVRPRLAPLLGPPSFDATWTTEPSGSVVETEEGLRPPTSHEVDTPRSPAHDHEPKPLIDPPASPSARWTAPLTPLTASIPAPEVFRPLALDLTSQTTEEQAHPAARPRGSAASERVVRVVPVVATTGGLPGPGPSRGGPLSFATRTPTMPGERRLPAQQVRSSEPNEPIIQVTIGRVEVRATPAPTAVHPVRPQAPRGGSLEEYLNRQSRRGGS